MASVIEKQFSISFLNKISNTYKCLPNTCGEYIKLLCLGNNTPRSFLFIFSPGLTQEKITKLKSSPGYGFCWYVIKYSEKPLFELGRCLIKSSERPHRVFQKIKSHTNLVYIPGNFLNFTINNLYLHIKKENY